MEHAPVEGKEKHVTIKETPISSYEEGNTELSAISRS
jgi:hypothetical protein